MCNDFALVCNSKEILIRQYMVHVLVVSFVVKLYIFSMGLVLSDDLCSTTVNHYHAFFCRSDIASYFLFL